jgi:hypothetical protein
MSISTGRPASVQAARAANDHPSANHTAAPASAHRPSTSAPEARPVHRLDVAGLEPDFARLVERSVAAACASPGDQGDVTFGDLGAIASFVHSARCHDGLMLQAGLALIAAQHPELTILTRDVELPVTEAAQALIARNRPGELSGIRLASEVFAREHYKADLIVVDEARRFAVVCDVKRSTASYNAARLGRLKAKLLACAVVAPDHLRTRHQIDGIRICHGAILDLSGHADLIDDDVFGIDALDDFLHLDGAGAALRDLKRRFGRAVQAELVRRLHVAFPAAIQPGRRSSGSGRKRQTALSETFGVNVEEDVADQSAGDVASGDAVDPDEFDGDRTDEADPFDRSRHRMRQRPPISVALARPVTTATAAA